MLKNAPLDASIRVDTAENRLFKVKVKGELSSELRNKYLIIKIRKSVALRCVALRSFARVLI